MTPSPCIDGVLVSLPFHTATRIAIGVDQTLVCCDRGTLGPTSSPSSYRFRGQSEMQAVSAALGVGPPLRQHRGGRCGAAGPAKALRIGSSSRGQLSAQQPPLGTQQWSGSSRAAGASLQCSASYAAAAAAPPPSAAEQPEQSQRQPLLPPWAARLVRLAATATAFAAWYQLAGVLGGPFASVGLAAPTANEGAGTLRLLGGMCRVWAM